MTIPVFPQGLQQMHTFWFNIAQALLDHCVGPSDSVAVNTLGGQGMGTSVVKLQPQMHARGLVPPKVTRPSRRVEGSQVKPEAEKFASPIRLWKITRGGGGACLPASLGQVVSVLPHCFFAFLKRPIRSRPFPSMKVPSGVGSSYPCSPLLSSGPLQQTPRPPWQARSHQPLDTLLHCHPVGVVIPTHQTLTRELGGFQPLEDALNLSSV